MNFDDAAKYLGLGEPVQREGWPQTLMVCQNPDGSRELWDELSETLVRYEPTDEDTAATDWLLVA